MRDFTYRKLDGPNGAFFRVLERVDRGSWKVAQGSIDWDTEEDARRQVQQFAETRKGYIVEFQA